MIKDIDKRRVIDLMGESISQTYSFVNIFPVSVGEIALEWGSNDTIEEFTVEFAYDYWTSLAGSTAVVT